MPDTPAPSADVFEEARKKAEAEFSWALAGCWSTERASDTAIGGARISFNAALATIEQYVATLREQLERTAEERDAAHDAIRWALGEGDSDFGMHVPANSGSYWWRKPLREKSGLVFSAGRCRSVRPDELLARAALTDSGARGVRESDITPGICPTPRLSAQGWLRGHVVRWDEEAETWLYADTLLLMTAVLAPAAAECRRVEGVISACCGHGVHERIVMYPEDLPEDARIDRHATPATPTCPTLYRKKLLQPMRPYIPGEDLSGISVNAEDTPEPGGMVAWNPDNPADQWYIAKRFFEDNYELATPATPEPPCAVSGEA